jgi:hypothetical protein
MLTLGLVCGLALGACHDDATRSEINAHAADDAGRDAAVAHQGDSGSAVDAGARGNTDETDARANVDVDSGARVDAGNDSGPAPAADSFIAVINTPCAEAGDVACAGHDDVHTLVCTSGKWTYGGTCQSNMRCDPTPGATLGTCQDIAQLCITKAPGDQVCDGSKRVRCDADRLRYDADACPAHAHCDASGTASCVCDSGYEDDGKGGCTNIDDCQSNTCGVSGACVDAVNAYTCNCPPGYSGVGTMMCTDIDECEGTNVCSSDYPCANTVPDYYCRGQFAEWPMPDHVAGAQTAPSYAADDETVTDNVTHLVWQKGAPAIYPACSGNSAMSGDTCTWEEAKAYCASQELATSLGGTGWRLPTKIELESLVDRTRSNPAIDPAFAMPATFRIYWTASPHVAVSGNAYFVDFSGGASSSFPAATTYRVRCVR